MDDEPANVRLVGRILQLAGIGHAHGVIDARQAIRCCLELDVDLMLLDLHMPTWMDTPFSRSNATDQQAELGLPSSNW